MPAILEIPEVRKRISPLSVQDYHRLGEYNERGRRTELIRGFIIQKMAKSPLHRAIASLLYDSFQAKVPAGYSVWKEESLTFVDSEPEPDISVIHGLKTDFISAHPNTAELVIEIAVSNPELDRENATLYAEARIKEYWIVLPTQRQIEVYRAPEGGTNREHGVVGADAIIACASLPQLSIRLADLFP